MRSTKVTAGRSCVKVAAGVIRRAGRVLITQRGAGERHALKWEFPGGKLEPGESHQACLRRELYEELGIGVWVGDPLARHLHYYAGKPVELVAFEARWIAGSIRLSVHSQYRWATPVALAKFDFLPADIPIIAHLLQDLDDTDNR